MTLSASLHGSHNWFPTMWNFFYHYFFFVGKIIFVSRSLMWYSDLKPDTNYVLLFFTFSWHSFLHLFMPLYFYLHVIPSKTCRFLPLGVESCFAAHFYILITALQCLSGPVAVLDCEAFFLWKTSYFSELSLVLLRADLNSWLLRKKCKSCEGRRRYRV